MSALIEGVSAIFSATLDGDTWMLKDALDHWSAYVLGIVFLLIGAFLVRAIFKMFPLFDRHFERTILIVSYLAIGMIIFVEVIRRFVFQSQAAWSTTLPPYLFLIMTWMGCAYNAKLRSHLSFDEVRSRMPRLGQFICLSIDAFLWLTFSLIVVVTSVKQSINSASNFQVLLGTDDVMQWWFYAWVPFSWVLLSARVVDNYINDIAAFKNDEKLIHPTALMANE